MEMNSSVGTLAKRKDFVHVEEEARAHSYRTYYYRKNDEIDNIISSCTSKIKSDPGNIKAIFLRATSLFKKRDYRNALNDFNEVIKHHPENEDCWYQRGVCFSKLDLFPEAIESFTKVLELNADHANAAFARAACFNKIGQFSRAIEDYNIALYKDQILANTRTNETRSERRRSGSFSSVNIYATPNSSAEIKSGSLNSSGGGGSGDSKRSRAVTPNSLDYFNQRRQNRSPSHTLIESLGLDYDQLNLSNSSAAPLTPIFSRESMNSNQFSDIDSSRSPRSKSRMIDNNVRIVSNQSNSLVADHERQNRTVVMDDFVDEDNHELSESRSYPSMKGSIHEKNSKQSLNDSNLVNKLTNSDKRTAKTLSPSSKSTTTAATTTTTTTTKTTTKTTTNTNTNTTSEDLVETYHAKGFQYRKEGNFPAAIIEYSQALKINPHHFKSLFNRGFAFDKLGEFQKAIHDYTLAVEIEPKNPYAYYNRGISQDRRGDLTAAYQDFSEAIALQPDNADFYHNRAFCLRKLGKFSEAVEDYSAALSLNPHHFKSLHNRAICYDKLGALPQALQDYSAALELQPSHIPSLNARATIWDRLGETEVALVDISHSLEVGVKTPFLLSTRAKLLSKLGRFEEAIEDLNDGLKISPEEASLLFTRGICWKALEKFLPAIQDFTTIINRDPSFIQAYLNRGYCYRKLDQLNEAIGDYSYVLQKSPLNIRAYNNRAYCYAKMEHYEEAIEDYSQVIEMDPTNAHAYHNRGISFDKIGKFDEAIADFSKVLQLDAGNTPSTIPSEPSLHPLSFSVAGSSMDSDQHEDSYSRLENSHTTTYPDRKMTESMTSIPTTSASASASTTATTTTGTSTLSSSISSTTFTTLPSAATAPAAIPISSRVDDLRSPPSTPAKYRRPSRSQPIPFPSEMALTFMTNAAVDSNSKTTLPMEDSIYDRNGTDNLGGSFKTSNEVMDSSKMIRPTTTSQKLNVSFHESTNRIPNNNSSNGNGIQYGDSRSTIEQGVRWSSMMNNNSSNNSNNNSNNNDNTATLDTKQYLRRDGGMEYSEIASQGNSNLSSNSSSSSSSSSSSQSSNSSVGSSEPTYSYAHYLKTRGMGNKDGNIDYPEDSIQGISHKQSTMSTNDWSSSVLSSSSSSSKHPNWSTSSMNGVNEGRKSTTALSKETISSDTSLNVARSNQGFSMPSRDHMSTNGSSSASSSSNIAQDDKGFLPRAPPQRKAPPVPILPQNIQTNSSSVGFSGEGRGDMTPNANSGMTTSNVGPAISVSRPSSLLSSMQNSVEKFRSTEMERESYYENQMENLSSLSRQLSSSQRTQSAGLHSSNSSRQGNIITAERFLKDIQKQ